ncbi:MAG TPA: PEP-CTERM sorting domain-containing protein [Rhizomicrobium sp.]|jgi:hypothetical protein|nr:PEP-CTERM sorting domain-containing protein [Rhizomicrobium sp.]
MRRYLLTTSASLLMTFSLLAPAQAAYTATIEQVGSNVVVTGSGTLDLDGLTYQGTDSFISGISPDEAVIGVGSPNSDPVDVYNGFSGPANFGSGGDTIPSNSGSGDKVAIEEFFDELGVPAGYLSNTPLADTSTYDNATFASLGLTPGTYEWTWTPVGDVTDDNFILQIGPLAATSVPEPLTLSLFGAGLAGAMAMRRRKIKV